MITYWQQIEGLFVRTKKSEIDTSLPLWIDARNVTRDESTELQETYNLDVAKNESKAFSKSSPTNLNVPVPFTVSAATIENPVSSETANKISRISQSEKSQLYFWTWAHSGIITKPHKTIKNFFIFPQNH